MDGERGFSDFTYSSQDGLRLAARVYGEARPDRLPVVCLAGLTRNARDFHELALHLSQGAKLARQVIAFDYRGRGRSEHDPDWRNYDVAVEAGDVIHGLTALGVARAAFIGTSRGGLIILALAALRPALIAAAVLNDIGPVIDGAGLAQIRAYLERAPKPATFEEAVAIQRAVHGTSFTALTDADFERHARAFYRQEKGRPPVPDMDPKLVRTLKGVDLDRPLPVLWPQFSGLAKIPIMAIRGENSRLLSAETLAEMQRRHPDLTAVTVGGQGHAPLLETAGLPERIAAFIDRAERARR